MTTTAHPTIDWTAELVDQLELHWTRQAWARYGVPFVGASTTRRVHRSEEVV